MQQLALSVPEAMKAIGLGRTAFYAAIKSGALPARKAGRRTIVLTSDIRSFLENLPRLGEAVGQPEKKG